MTDGVKKVVLPNGLTILVLENHKAPVANFNVFYRVGSRNEQVGKTGLRHLLEHLMFRGTKKLKPEEFSNIIQENGGEDNAFTEQDFTDYFEIINRDHLDVPISLEADRMANFEPKGFDSEKAVVMEERRLRTEDNPAGRAGGDDPGAGLRRASLSLAGHRMDARNRGHHAAGRARLSRDLLLAAKRDRL